MTDALSFVPTTYSRRNWLRIAAGSAAAAGSGLTWLPQLLAGSETAAPRKRSCILLWMAGGPSQLDTFDPKPDHANGGPVKGIDTNVDGIRIVEHLPRLARHMDKMALIRSMSTKEGDHGRATYLVRTGRVPQGPVRYPTFGAVAAKELRTGDSELPAFISIAAETGFNPAAYSAGFLGARHTPLLVGGDRDGYRAGQSLQVRNITPAVGVLREQFEKRMTLLSHVDQKFAESHPAPTVESRRIAQDAALRMMRGNTQSLFDLSSEPQKVRDAYGRTLFGQGCLLARRLIEQGVPVVEVTLSRTDDGNSLGWDSHTNNFEATRGLCGMLDSAWSTLMEELQDRGLLESTLIVWMGEFGRTPTINNASGRDHYSSAWSTVLAGGGIRGGQVVGKTSADGMKVEDRPITIPDLHVTICQAIGIDPMSQNMSNIGRPIRIVEPEAKPIDEVLA